MKRKGVRAKVHWLTGLLVLMALIVCSPATSWAILDTQYIDFNMDANHPAGAVIDYLAGRDTLKGVNIGVDTVGGFKSVIIGGLKYSVPTVAALNISNGILDFETGKLSSHVGNVWTFGGGGHITITGAIPAIGLNNPTQLMFNGSFKSAQVVYVGWNNFNIALGGFTDEKDSTLVQYFFGTNYRGFEGGLNLSFLADPNAASGYFSSTAVLSGDVTNNVPLPGAVWLLGTGLIGLVGVRRRLRG